LAACIAAAMLAGCAGMTGDQPAPTPLAQAIKEHGAMSCCKDGMCKPAADGKPSKCGCCAKHALATMPGKMGADTQPGMCMDQMNKAPKQSAG
jgi:hypothetical protein